MVAICTTRFNIQLFYVLPTQCIYVLCVSQNKLPLFFYTAWTGWFSQPWRIVFTARYEIDIYTQLRWFSCIRVLMVEKTNPTLHPEIMAINAGQLVCNCKWQGALAGLVCKSDSAEDANGLVARSQRPALATVQNQINARCEWYGTDSCGSWYDPVIVVAKTDEHCSVH